MKKILAAIDGSDTSLHAARMAFEIARATGGEVTLVHVVPSMVLPGEEPFVAMPDLMEAQKTRAQKLVADAKHSLDAMNATTVVLEGSPASEIVRLADELAADLIVVGSHGRGAVARLLVGSVADGVVHLAKQPVLVVK